MRATKIHEEPFVVGLSIPVFILGLLLVALSQLLRAIVDTADHTSEMLAIMKAHPLRPPTDVPLADERLGTDR